jgi:FdhD protein
MKGEGVIKKYPVLRFERGEMQRFEDWVAIEGTYELYLNDTLVDTIVVSPADLEAHALGYLVTEGFLKPEEVQGVDRQGDQVIVRTSMKKIISFKASYQNLIYRRREWEKIPLVSSPLKVTPALIIQCAQQIPVHSKGWKKTGGIHCSILFDEKGSLIKAAEDIGRWNTVDKVVGYAHLYRIPLMKTILVCSGRQPEGMVLKAARAKIPIVVTKAAVIDRGIEAAERLGVTLIGFARAGRFTIYAHPERVQVVSSPVWGEAVY